MKNIITADLKNTGKCHYTGMKETFWKTLVFNALPKKSPYTKSVSKGYIENVLFYNKSIAVLSIDLSCSLNLLIWNYHFGFFKDFAFARSWATWRRMGKMVRTFTFKVHEGEWTKQSTTSTVNQEHEQPLRHPDRRLSSFVDCFYLGENDSFSSSAACYGRLIYISYGLTDEQNNICSLTSHDPHLYMQFGRKLFLADWEQQPLLLSLIIFCSFN